MSQTNGTSAMPKLRRMEMSQFKEEHGRRRFFLPNPSAGTTQHSLMHPDFWAAVRSQLQRNDIITVIVNGDDGELQRWEAELSVESVTPDVVVSLRQRISRKPLSADIERLDDGGYIQWYAADDGVHKAFTVFKSDGKPTPITGHQTIGAARHQWAREQPRKG